MSNNPVSFAEETLRNINNHAYIAGGKLYYHSLINGIAREYEKHNTANPEFNRCSSKADLTAKLSCAIGAMRARKIKTLLYVCPTISLIVTPIIEKLNEDYEGLNIEISVNHFVQTRGKVFLFTKLPDETDPIDSLVVINYLNCEEIIHSHNNSPMPMMFSK